MSEVLSKVDPDGLLEYSVVFTERSLNHMSNVFQGVMRDISSTMKDVYNADATVMIPGGGTYGMEAVARQFANGKNCMVIRNGWFSFRWTQIFEAGNIPASTHVMTAGSVTDDHQAAFAPAAIEDAVAWIEANKPDLVFAPHVETSAGIRLPDAYIKAVTEAVHSVGGLFVLDCVASGTDWVDMKKLGVDVLVTAPQKGWSSSPSCGLVMMSGRALEVMATTESSSFACNLAKWHSIMQAYENGGHAYHATMPTDALRDFRDTMMETREYGFEKLKAEQEELGTKIRKVIASAGFKSVAAPGFEAPSVVVAYTDDVNIHNGSKFAAQGLQIAAGVPLQCGEPEDFRTFRIGLFGLDKWQNIERTVERFENALNEVLAGKQAA